MPKQAIAFLWLAMLYEHGHVDLVDVLITLTVQVGILGNASYCSSHCLLDGLALAQAYMLIKLAS